MHTVVCEQHQKHVHSGMHTAPEACPQWCEAAAAAPKGVTKVGTEATAEAVAAEGKTEAEAAEGKTEAAAAGTKAAAGAKAETAVEVEAEVALEAVAAAEAVAVAVHSIRSMYTAH